ncbi:MAG: secretin N-terminal domain-containing protein [Gammaproteobacteria bacterium]
MKISRKAWIACAALAAPLALVLTVPGRTAPSPVVDGNDKHADSEIVTRVFRVKSVPALQLIPILRSLLPQSAHLAAVQCTNEILVVDTYANVRRIENIVATLDKGDTLPLPKCTLPAFPPAPPPPSMPPQE